MLIDVKMLRFCAVTWFKLKCDLVKMWTLLSCYTTSRLFIDRDKINMQLSYAFEWLWHLIACYLCVCVWIFTFTLHLLTTMSGFSCSCLCGTGADFCHTSTFAQMTFVQLRKHCVFAQCSNAVLVRPELAEDLTDLKKKIRRNLSVELLDTLNNIN